MSLMAVFRSCVRFSSFRYRFKALRHMIRHMRDWSLILVFYVIKILFNLNSQGNEKLKLFSYDFRNLGNEAFFITNHENVKKSAFDWLTAKLWLKESTILWNVCTFE